MAGKAGLATRDWRLLRGTARTVAARAALPATVKEPPAARAGRPFLPANGAVKSTASAAAHVATVRGPIPGRSTTWRVSRPRIRSRTPRARKIAWTPGRAASSPIQPRPASAGATRKAAPARTRPAAIARAASRALTALLLARRDDRDDPAATARAELDHARPLGEDRVGPAE